MTELIKDWHIKNLPEETRYKITVYAAVHKLSLAEALTELVDKALADAAVAA